MAKHIIIDLGHSKCDSGAVANGFKEVDLNVSIGRYVGKELSRHGVIVTYAEGSLSDRSNLDKRLKPHAFVSIHNNAGGGDGTEVYHFPSSIQGKKISNYILAEIVSAGLNNSRGVKTANYHVLRETVSPSTLIECAFMDSADIKAVDEEHERKAFGTAIAKGVLKYLGLNYIPESTPVISKVDKYYRVIVGSYKDRTNAEAQQKKLKEKGFDSFLEVYNK